LDGGNFRTAASDRYLLRAGVQANHRRWWRLASMERLRFTGFAIKSEAEGLLEIAAKVALELRNCYVLGFSASEIPAMVSFVVCA
jgi:hypothetical protein